MHDRIEKIQNHFKENKTVYLAGAGGVVIGAIGVFVTSGGGVQIVDSMKLTLVNWKSPHTSQTVMIRRGHPGNIIRCDQTGELFASQARAAKANNISGASLSMHLRGLKENVKGLTFNNLGEATAVA